MRNAYFITGTDTDAGKTWATVGLLHFFKKQGCSVIGMKPVAAGCEWRQGRLKNEDALLLQQHSSAVSDYSLINPYAFEMAISPHLAGSHNPVQLPVVVQAFEQLSKQAEVILVEGAGGWLAPVNDRQDIADLACALKIPVILVVAIRLGCINHARLTLQAIQTAGVECAGWIANCMDADMSHQDDNISTLENKLSAPLLGVLPYSKKLDPEAMAKQISEKNLI